jgi:hypothetical protein
VRGAAERLVGVGGRGLRMFEDDCGGNVLVLVGDEDEDEDEDVGFADASNPLIELTLCLPCPSGFV